jgi:hypothetical protein
VRGVADPRRRRQSLFRARALGLAIALLVLGLATACEGYRYTLVYRYSFTISVDGETKSASSLIQILFYGSDRPEASGARGFTSVKGFAPVIDLGPHGWLVAAMRPDGVEWFHRHKDLGLSCKDPAGVDQFPSVLGPGVKALTAPESGLHVLPDRLYPAFIWFPPNRPFTDAVQICPEEFSRVIGARVDLKSVTVEVTPGAAAEAYLKIEAPWLEEIRKIQWRSYPGEEIPHIDFKALPKRQFLPNLKQQIETRDVVP